MPSYLLAGISVFCMVWIKLHPAAEEEEEFTNPIYRHHGSKNACHCKSLETAIPLVKSRARYELVASKREIRYHYEHESAQGNKPPANYQVFVFNFSNRILFKSPGFAFPFDAFIIWAFDKGRVSGNVTRIARCLFKKFMQSSLTWPAK